MPVAGTPPLTVIHLITGLGSGGAERQLVALATGCDRRRVQPVVISLVRDGFHAETLRDAGVPLYFLGQYRSGEPQGLFSRLQGALRAFVELQSIIRKHQPAILQTWLYHADLAGTVVSLSGLLSPAGILSALRNLLRRQTASRPAPGSRPRLIWTLRCSDMQLDHYSALTRLVVRLLARLSRYPDRIVANSAAGMKAHLGIGYHPRSRQVIANGIDCDLFRPDAAARQEVRAAWGVTGSTRVIGCIARHDPMKNHAGLLRAFASLPKELSATSTLVFIGKGTSLSDEPFLQDIRQAGLSPSSLICLGEQQNVSRLLCGLDGFVLPSSFGEGFPNAVAEAMSCSLPGLVTDVGDAAAVLGAAGRVIPCGDDNALAEGLCWLVDLPPDERQRTGATGRDRIRNLYSPQAMIEAYTALWEQVSGRTIVNRPA